MSGLPKVGTNWFDHDRGRVWRIQMITFPKDAASEITMAYANGEEMGGFELLPPEELAARVAVGRYELIEA